MSEEIVLLHGAWHTPACWENLYHYQDNFNLKKVKFDTQGENANLASYVEQVILAIKACKRRVTIIAHSMSGVIATRLAIDFPELICKVIYLAAYIPEPNKSIHDCFITDNNYLHFAMKLDKKQQILYLRAKKVAKYFYNNICPADISNYILPQSQLPLVTKVSYHMKDLNQLSNNVDCEYIVCGADQIISAKLQTKMAQLVQAKIIYKEHFPHSPFYTSGFLNSILGACAK